MRCRGCEADMDLLMVWDNGSTPGTHAWNLYACEPCGIVMQEQVWHGAEQRWLLLGGIVRDAPGQASGRD